MTPFRLACPFCASTHVQTVSVTDRLAGFECGACQKTWSEVPGLDDLPRPKAVKVPLRCPECGDSSLIRKETTVTSDMVRETFTCSRCQASWSAGVGDKTA